MNIHALAVAVALLMLSPLANAQGISGPPYIAVHGEAKMEVVPDTFPLEITIRETSKDTAATQATVETLARAIAGLAQEQIVADEDVSISNLSISPEMEYDEKTETQVFLGNTYEREIKLRFHSLDGLRSFLAKIPAAKQIQIDTGNFTYSKTNEIKKSLVKRALQNARATADEMASGVGKRIGAVHTVSNQGFNVRYSEATSLDTITVTGTRAMAPGAVVLKEGRITLDQDIYVVYSLAE